MLNAKHQQRNSGCFTHSGFHHDLDMLIIRLFYNIFMSLSRFPVGFVVFFTSVVGVLVKAMEIGKLVNVRGKKQTF